MRQTSEPHVVAICGSLRDRSKTRTVLEASLSAAREAGGSTELVDLRSYDLPSLNAVDSEPPDAARLRDHVTDADAVILGTPNYHGSYSGALKDALDYCGRDEFEETSVGLVEVAAGDFPGSALAHLRTVSRTLNAWTLPTEVAVPNSHSVVTRGSIGDEELRDRVEQLGRELVAYAGVARYPETVERAVTERRGETDD